MSNSIAVNLQRLITAKENIATAITNKGGTVQSGDGFEEFYTDISTIPTATLGTKSITDNGTYNASSDGVDGYSQVVVNVRDCDMTKQDTIGFTSVKGTPNYISTWTAKTWNGLTSFTPAIWTDGNNIYYSSGSNQYVLDKSASTWTEKTWNGSISQPNSVHIWTDGNDIYYSNNSDQYVLDKSMSTWTNKTWSGLTSFTGNRIWTDGHSVFYSYSTTQMKLNVATSTWSGKSWTDRGGNRLLPSGDAIWSDGINIYYSNYVLDKSTITNSSSRFIDISWTGLTNVYANYIWTDGDNIYYSYNSNQYVLSKDETIIATTKCKPRLE